MTEKVNNNNKKKKVILHDYYIYHTNENMPSMMRTDLIFSSVLDRLPQE